jgi:hypothetical protein
MTQREIALYETVKILLNQLISSELLDYKQTRDTLRERAQLFEKNGYSDAAAMMATLRMAIEPKRSETVSRQPLVAADGSVTPDLSHAVIVEI